MQLVLFYYGWLHKQYLIIEVKMKKQTNITTFFEKPKVNRKGVHSKAKTSQNKKSKNYKKLNRGQG